MADDLVINVKQIAQYDQVTATAPTDRWLLQQSGVGGPYKSIAPPDAVGTALELGGYLRLAPGGNGGLAFNGAILGFANGAFEFSEDVHVPSLHSDGDIFVAGDALATQKDMTAIIDAVINDSVWSFNGRQGNVILESDDILRAGGILQWNPHFHGVVTAPTFWDFRDSSDRVATTAWVQGVIGALLCSGSVVTSFNGRGGAITLTADDISLAATFPGAMPRANTPPLGDASTRIATTMFVDDTVFDMENRLTILINNQTDFALAAYAPLASPAFTGVPTAPTANPGTTTGQLATTAFVQNAVAAATAGVSSFNTRTGAITLTTADVTGAGGAPINAPSFTGIPLAPTAATATNTQQIATTAFVHALMSASNMVASFNTRTGAVVLTTADITGAGGAPSASPALSGTPTAPTAVAGTNTTQIATTAYVQAALGTVTGAVSSWNGRTGAVTLQANDISAAGGALLAGPAFTGNPTAPTQPNGTNNTTLATTAFVLANSAAGGVTSFNGRTGAITLVTADVTAAGGAPLSSPAFSGAPTAPTAAQTVNDTTIATTAYVRAAVAAATGVSTFNTRTGAVTLLLSDVTSAGGAPLASPILTGNPQAPTQSPGNATTSLATTAFVAAAVAAGVTSFNGRTGPITFIANDITSAGGALLASPTFSGTPNAPTPTTGTNNTQIATTAFVNAAITAAGGVTYKQSDTAPTPRTNFWFDSLNGQLYVNYIDPSTSTPSWVIANSFTPPAPTPASGSRVLLGTVTISTPVASVDFTNVFSSTYDVYEFVGIHMQGDTSGAGLGFRFSADGGATWRAGASDYYYAWGNAGTAGASASGGNQSYINFGPGIYPSASAPTIGDSVVAQIMRPWATNFNGQTLWRYGGNDNLNNVYSVHGFGYMQGWFAANSLRMMTTSGNLVHGTFNLYGIAK